TRLPENIGCLSFGNRGFQTVSRLDVLAPNIDERRFRTDGIAAQRHAFEHAVRLNFDQLAILECAGLGFVGIARDVLGAWLVGDEAPLGAAWEARAAAAPQPRGFDLLDDFVGRHRGERLAPAVIALLRLVLAQTDWRGAARVRE